MACTLRYVSFMSSHVLSYGFVQLATRRWHALCAVCGQLRLPEDDWNVLWVPWLQVLRSLLGEEAVGDRVKRHAHFCGSPHADGVFGIGQPGFAVRSGFEAVHCQWRAGGHPRPRSSAFTK